jgi:hypothetical protein
VPDSANHIFYTGTTERLRIKSDGNVGIGTNDPQTKLDVRGKINAEIPGAVTGLPENGIYGGNGTRLILYPGTASTVGYSLGIAGGAMWYATPAGTTSHNFYNGTTNIASFLNTSFEILILKSPANTNYQLLFAPPSSTSGAAIQTIQQGTGYNQDLTLQPTAGNVGIGTSDPNNILQVGDGARLRISNGISDYTLIGTKNVDDSTNTCIYINGNTRTTFAGKIHYYATTATGDHTFYTNGSSTLANTLANFAPTKNTFYKNVRAVNYENEGILYPHSTLTNSGGSSLNGYFIPVSDYTNSLMTCAFSHDSTSYTYWRGHVSIGNNNQILGVSSPILGSNLLVESFIQQTTLIQFIRVIPTVSYSSSVQLRVKIYG